MITFEHLQFQCQRIRGGCGRVARIFFPNGYGVSVMGGDLDAQVYGNGETTFELAVIKGNQKYWEQCYDTPITNDVIGHNSKDEVTELMQKVAAL